MYDKYGTITIEYAKYDYFNETTPNLYYYRAISNLYRLVGEGDSQENALNDLKSKINSL